MAVQIKMLRFCNLWGSCRSILGNVQRYNLPNYQQVAGLRQSLEEKYNLPTKPKRPLTPYFKFMIKIRPDLKKEKPTASVTDLVRETAVRWEKVDPQTKHELEVDYKKEQEAYSKERLEYDTKLTQEQKNILKQVREDRTEDREKRKYRKKCKENNKPKKACSAFVLYMKNQMSKRGSMKFRDFQKQLAENWQKLSEAEKKPYFEEVEKQMKEYQKQMVEWERKMIKLGNTDIVRQDALIVPKPKSKGKKSE